jgi:hypothetical protein
MQFTISVVLGILLGVLLLSLMRPRATPDGGSVSQTGWPVWLPLGMGAAAALALAATLLNTFNSNLLTMASIALPVAAVVVSAVSLRRGNRRWMIWAGLALGLLPALFWAAFAIGELVGPPH